jgi:hypothetical protein
MKGHTEMVTLGMEIRRVHRQIDRYGYAVTTDEEIGFSAVARKHIASVYFTDEVLSVESDPSTFPPNRLRARDVLRYTWPGSAQWPLLAKFDDVSLTTPIGLAGEHPHGKRRTYSRVDCLADPLFATLIEKQLSLTAPPDRQKRGTFSVNLLRTHTDVVKSLHQDGEQYVIIYVVDRDAEGGETSLHSLGSPHKKVFAAELRPGEMLIFRDAEFLHTASPIRPAAGNNLARRDVLICTVDYPETHPLA